MSGRVVDAATGLGISDVHLSCVQVGRELRPTGQSRHVTTSESGQFTLEDLGPGTWLLLPSHPEYMLPLLVSLITMQSDDLGVIRLRPEDALQRAKADGAAIRIGEDGVGAEPLLIQMTRGAVVRGRVTGPDGTPIVQSPIYLRIPHWGPLALHWPVLLDELRSRVVAMSDDEGRFQVLCLPAALGQVRLGTMHEHLLCRWSDPIDLSDPEGVHLQLCEPATIEGCVLWSDGRPEPDAYVRLEASPAWVSLDAPLWSNMGVESADASGRFRFAQVPPDDVTVRAFAAEDDDAQAELTVTGLTPGETRTGIQVVFDDQHFIRGRLVSADGEPIEDECLSANGPNGEEEDWDTDCVDWTDEEGRFALQVPIAGPVEIWLETANRSVRLATDVHVPCADLVLVATPTPRVTFTVQVRDPNGHPVPSFRLCGWSSGERGQYSQGELGTDGRAAVAIQGLPPYHLLVKEARDEEGEPLPYAPYGVEIPPGTNSPIKVTLSGKGEFYGRVLDLKDEPIPGVRLLVREGDGEREIPVAEDGRFRFAAADATTREIDGGRLILPEGYRDWTFVLTLHAGVPSDIRAVGGGMPVKGHVVFIGEGTASVSGPGRRARLGAGRRGRGRKQCGGEYGRGRVLHVLRAARRRQRPRQRPRVQPGGERTDRRGSARHRLGWNLRCRPEGADGSLHRWTYRGAWRCRPRLPGSSRVSSALAWVRKPVPPANRPDAHVRRLPYHRDGARDLPHRPARLELPAPTARLGGRRRSGREDVVLTLPRLSGSIHGVIDTKGLSEGSERRVAMWNQDGSNFLVETFASPDGHFEFDRLDPEGHYAIRYGAQVEGVWMVAVQSDVRPGAEIHLEPVPGLSIVGLVAGALGDQQVVAVMAVSHGMHYFADVNPTDGAFRFEGMYPGTYELVVLGPGLVRGKAKRGVEAGSTGVLMDLR